MVIVSKVNGTILRGRWSKQRAATRIRVDLDASSASNLRCGLDRNEFVLGASHHNRGSASAKDDGGTNHCRCGRRRLRAILVHGCGREMHREHVCGAVYVKDGRWMVDVGGRRRIQCQGSRDCSDCRRCSSGFPGLASIRRVDGEDRVPGVDTSANDDQSHLLREHGRGGEVDRLLSDPLHSVDGNACKSDVCSGVADQIFSCHLN